MKKSTTYFLLFFFGIYTLFSFNGETEIKSVVNGSEVCLIEKNQTCCLEKADCSDNKNHSTKDENNDDSCCNAPCCNLKINTSVFIASSFNIQFFNTTSNEYCMNYIFTHQDYTAEFFIPPKV